VHPAAEARRGGVSPEPRLLFRACLVKGFCEVNRFLTGYVRHLCACAEAEIYMDGKALRPRVGRRSYVGGDWE